jgi:hypothetical protein
LHSGVLFGTLLTRREARLAFPHVDHHNGRGNLMASWHLDTQRGKSTDEIDVVIAQIALTRLDDD